eukprot:gene10407-2936_t
MLCCIRQKAISTRGILPFLSLIGILIYDIRIILSVPSFLKVSYLNSYTNNWTCWWLLFTCTPSIAFFAVLQSISSTKYLMKKRLDNLKTDTFLLHNSRNQKELKEISDNETIDFDEVSVEAKKAINKIEIQIKILKFLSSNVVHMFLMFFFTIIVVIGQLIVSGSIELATHEICTFAKYKEAEYIAGGMAFPYLIVLIIYVICTIIIDVISFTRERGCAPSDYFFNDDPFGFRLQMFINTVGIAAALYGATYVPLSYFFADPNSHSYDKYIAATYIPFTEIIYNLSFGYFGIFIFAFQWIRKKRRKNTYSNEFDAMINDPKGRKIFKRYSQAEWSLENILYYEEVMNYLQSPSIKFAKRLSQEILNNFIQSGAPLEVNLSGSVRRPLIQKLNNFDDYAANYLNIFNDSIEEVKRNMRDTFSRIPQNELKTWITSSQVKVETVIVN